MSDYENKIVIINPKESIDSRRFDCPENILFNLIYLDMLTDEDFKDVTFIFYSGNFFFKTKIVSKKSININLLKLKWFIS
jgi:hypothetical protein